MNELFEAAAQRVNNNIDMRCLVAKLKLQGMAQSARRSIGQKIRFAKGRVK